jgi:hypothetical protein
MFVFRELALRLGTDATRGRIRCDAIRKIPLDLLQLSEEPIVFCVRESGTIEDVVFVRCARQQRAQLRGTTIVLLAGLLRTRLVGAGILGRFLLLL